MHTKRLTRFLTDSIGIKHPDIRQWLGRLIDDGGSREDINLAVCALVDINDLTLVKIRQWPSSEQLGIDRWLALRNG
jgi:hypothetical protein